MSSSITVHLIFFFILRHGLSLTLELIDSARLTGQQTPGQQTPVSASLGLRLQMYADIPSFHMGAGKPNSDSSFT